MSFDILKPQNLKIFTDNHRKSRINLSTSVGYHNWQNYTNYICDLLFLLFTVILTVLYHIQNFSHSVNGDQWMRKALTLLVAIYYSEPGGKAPATRVSSLSSSHLWDLWKLSKAQMFQQKNALIFYLKACLATYL